VLEGAAVTGEHEAFCEAWAAMKKVGVEADQETLCAFMLMEAKLGVSPSIEAVWAHPQFTHIKHPRTDRLMEARVDAHCQVATNLLRIRDRSGTGGANRAGGRVDRGLAAGLGVAGKSVGFVGFDSMEDRKKVAASEARKFAAAALDEMYELFQARRVELNVNNSPRSHMERGSRRHVRDATSHMMHALALVGSTEKIHEWIQRLEVTTNWRADQYMYDILLRSEGADRLLGVVDGVELDTGRKSEAWAQGLQSLERQNMVGKPRKFDHAKDEAQRAVLRVEDTMRQIVESGLQPNRHSFMALLNAYAKVGDVRAAGDCLSGMMQRGIKIDTWAFNVLIMAAAAACDLEAASKIRDQMRKMDIPADHLTFRHLFTACNFRYRQVHLALLNTEDADDGDDWGTSKQLSHASLAAAMLQSGRGQAGNASGLGQFARAGVDAAREGLSSVAGIFSGDPSRAANTPAGELALHGMAESPNPTPDRHGVSPVLVRAGEIVARFRADMTQSGVAHSMDSAHALVKTLGTMGEFSQMLHFVHNLPDGLKPDSKMYNIALTQIAEDGAHKRKIRGRRGYAGAPVNIQSEVETGPEAALAMLDDLLAKGHFKPDVSTLIMQLLACAQLEDFDQAVARFDAHEAAGNDMSAHAFVYLFKVALNSGGFSRHAPMVAAMWDARGGGVPPPAMGQVLRRAGSLRQINSRDRDVAQELLVKFGFESEVMVSRQEAYKTMRESSATATRSPGSFYGGGGRDRDSRASPVAADNNAADDHDDDGGGLGHRGGHTKTGEPRWRRVTLSPEPKVQ